MEISLQNIYSLRYYILTIRFFPLFLSVLLTILYIIPTFTINSEYFLYSLLSIMSAYLFSEFFVRFKQKMKYAQELHIKEDFEKEYRTYNELLSQILWPSERFRIKLYLSRLLYRIGNYKRFIELIDELSTDIEKYPKENNLYSLLRAFYFEIKLDLSKAINELENINENTINRNIKLQVYNNRARIEELLGNKVSAVSFYEKSFSVLKEKPEANFFPIIIHNLLLSYAKQNKFKKANILLDEYWEMIDKKDPKQVNKYANDMLHYARQVNDRTLLDKSNKIVIKNLEPLLKKDTHLILQISQLRMKYNDNMEFDKHYINTLNKIKLNKETFSLIEKLNILKELKHILTQKINSSPSNIKWIEDFKWARDWNLSLKNNIELEMKNIEPNLSDMRVFWIKQLIELQKSKMVFPRDINESINMDDLDLLVQYIKEIINIWNDVDNKEQEISEIIHLIDELFSYYIQTNDIRILNKYKDEMSIYLIEVESLLEKYWKVSSSKEQLIALSWFFLKFQKNHKKALYWIHRFDSLNISLNHYAQYIRIWYKSIKKIDYQ